MITDLCARGVVMPFPVQVVFWQRGRHIECGCAVAVLRRWTDAVTLLGRRSTSTLQQRAALWSRWTVPLSARRRHRKTAWSRSDSYDTYLSDVRRSVIS